MELLVILFIAYVIKKESDEEFVQAKLKDKAFAKKLDEQAERYKNVSTESLVAFYANN